MSHTIDVMEKERLSYTGEIFSEVIKRNAGEKEFHQAVNEVLTSLEPVFEKTQNSGKQESLKDW